MQLNFALNPLKTYLLLWLAASLFGFSSAQAHEIQPSIVDFTYNKAGYYQMAVRLNMEALLADIGTKHDDTSKSDNATKYDRLRDLDATSLANEFDQFSETFINGISLTFDGKRQPLSILDMEIPDVGDIELARESVVNFAGLIPEKTRTMQWQWDKRFGNAVLRIATDDNPELYSSYLVDGNASDVIEIGGDCSKKNAEKGGGCLNQTSAWDSFVNYVSVGFQHIVPKGIDHILFVVGLFLLSTHLKPLLIQITTFTLAHSISLALGIFGIINVSASIVEPLIAASIIYVCIENIFSDHLSRWRPILVFLFGLLHGLGFASVLKEFGLSQSNFISGLLGFNIGVELGQIAVVLACFLLIGIWFGNKDWYRSRITIPASIVIALIAVYWLLERTGVIA